MYIVITFSKKFDWCADFGAGIFGSGTDGPDDWLLGRIIDVSEFPREKEVDTVHCRDCNMQRIGFRDRGNTVF